MKFSCENKILLDAVTLVQKAVSNRSTLPVLECVLIEVIDENIYLTGNDLSFGIKTKGLPVLYSIDGSCAIDGKLLGDIVRKLPENELVSFERNGNVVIIKSGKSEYKMMCLDASEYPVLPDALKDKHISIPSELFKDMVKKTIFSVSPDNPKQVLTGELINITDGSIFIVAIDGFRIACAIEPFNGETENMRCIVPAHVLNEVIKIIPNDEENINMYITDRKITFEFDKCTVVSSLIEGDYVRFDQVFLNDFTTSITLNRDSFLKSVERVALMAGREANKSPIKFNIVDNSLTITTNTEIGTAKDELEINQTGLPIDITFNPKYLIDILKIAEEEDIMLGFNTSLSPCIIRGIGNEARKYLVLPLRVKN